MTVKEVITTLITAYEAKIQELKSPKEKAFEGLRKVRDVFIQQKNKKTIYELVALMMQPDTEEVFFSPVEDPLSKGYQKVKVNIKTGMGLKVDTDSQIEILGFISSKEFDGKRFSSAFANALTETMRRYKS